MSLVLGRYHGSSLVAEWVGILLARCIMVVHVVLVGVLVEVVVELTIVGEHRRWGGAWRRVQIGLLRDQAR